MYTGSCHCGSVKVAVRTKPLPEADVRECNCSICMRVSLFFWFDQCSLNTYSFFAVSAAESDLRCQHGRILCYPQLQQVQVFGKENISSYQYGYNRNRFCKTCGVPVDIEILVRPAELTQTWTPETLEFFEKATRMHPVNVRILNGVEWKGEPGETGGEDDIGVVKVGRVFGKDFPHPLDEDQG